MAFTEAPGRKTARRWAVGELQFPAGRAGRGAGAAGSCSSGREAPTLQWANGAGGHFAAGASEPEGSAGVGVRRWQLAGVRA